MLIGMRIPRHFFIAMGTGESDLADHAGSFHIALQDAGIEMCNIMQYSSILPAIAEQVSKPELVHGSVMEVIMSQQTVENAGGLEVHAGIGYGWLYHRETGLKYGGIVCERGQVGGTDEGLSVLLQDSLVEIYQGFVDQYELRDVKLLVKGFRPSARYGTALVSLCFVDYEVEEVGLCHP